MGNAVLISTRLEPRQEGCIQRYRVSSRGLGSVFGDYRNAKSITHVGFRVPFIAREFITLHTLNWARTRTSWHNSSTKRCVHHFS